MQVINYKLSDADKFNALWSLLNENFTEEGNWTVDYDICEIYDEYAVVKNYAENSFERIYYTKDNETDTVSLGERKKCYFLDVTEEEKNALDLLHALNNGTYELANETFEKGLNFDGKVTEYEAQIAEYNEKVSEFEQKIEEQVASISTLQTENEELVASYDALKAENTELQTYKLNKENAEKQSIIDKYAAQLDEEVIKNYTEKIAEFTKVDLEKELVFALVQSKPSIFSLQGQANLIPQEDSTPTGLGDILEKYRK